MTRDLRLTFHHAVSSMLDMLGPDKYERSRAAAKSARMPNLRSVALLMCILLMTNCSDRNYSASNSPVTTETETSLEDSRPVVAFGDSYTEGTGVDADSAYPAVLQKSIGITVKNAGRLGQTAKEAFPRLKADVLDRNPRLVIVEFGVNEAFRGYPVSESLEGLDGILSVIAARGIPIVVVGVHFAEYQDNFDEGLRKLSQKYEAGLVLDVLGGILDSAALRSDRYHPNEIGYRIMAERILPEARRILNAGIAGVSK